jgi:hypothetical protein
MVYVYLILKNLVLWAGSEIIGYAILIWLNWNIGIMECWSNGYSGILSIFGYITTRGVQFWNPGFAF